MIRFEDWNTIDYTAAWQKQQECFNRAVSRKHDGLPTDDIVFFCEHTPVITLGRHGKAQNLLIDRQVLLERGIGFVNTDRGGDITFHGPGQQIMYPVIDLEHFRLGLKDYVNTLEQIVIDLIAGYGIRGTRIHGASGVWLDAGTAYERKICAVGVHSSRHITMHGIGLNVNTDLRCFSYINPCGFVEKGVTSMERELGHVVDMEEIKAKLRQGVTRYFKTSL